MIGSLRSSAIRASATPTLIFSASSSRTHGPAMRKNSFLLNIRHGAILAVLAIRLVRLITLLDGCADESRKQRMRAQTHGAAHVGNATLTIHQADHLLSCVLVEFTGV